MLGEDIARKLTPLEVAEPDALRGQPNSLTVSVTNDANRQSAAWDLAQAPKNYLVLVTAQAFGSLLSLASVWLATRYLGPAGYGGVVAFIAAAQVAMMIGVNWTSFSVSRYGCEEFVQTGQIASTFWTRLVILGPNLLLVLAATPLWLPKLGGILRLPPNSTWLVLSLLVANVWWIHVQQALQGAKLMRLQGWLLTLERGLIFLVLGYLAMTGGVSVSRVGWLYVLGPVGASLFALARLRKLIWPVTRLDVGMLNRILRFSIPMIPTMAVGYLSTSYLDALFITHFLSEAKLGIYSVAYQVTGLTQQLPLLAGVLLMPLFVTLQAGKRGDRTERYMREVLPSITLIWTLLCGVVAAVGSYLVPLVFGSKFEETALLLWPLMAASALAGPDLMGYTPITNSSSKTHLQMISVTLGSAANVILNLLLVPRFGLLGCAWATTAGYGVTLIAVYFLVHRRVIAKRTWVLQAALPIVLGALYASWFPRDPIALGVTFGAGALVALAHRKCFVSAFNNLSKHTHFVFYGRPPKDRPA